MKTIIVSLIMLMVFSSVAAYAAEVNCTLPSRVKNTGDVYQDNVCSP